MQLVSIVVTSYTLLVTTFVNSFSYKYRPWVLLRVPLFPHLRTVRQHPILERNIILTFMKLAGRSRSPQ